MFQNGIFTIKKLSTNVSEWYIYNKETIDQCFRMVYLLLRNYRPMFQNGIFTIKKI